MELLAAKVPKRTVTALNKKHIYTTDDLIKRFPRKYKDYRNVISIVLLVLNQVINTVLSLSVCGTILNIRM